VDPRVGKMLIYASVMQCLPAVLTIAAGMAYKDPWVMPLDKKQAADEARRKFAGEVYIRVYMYGIYTQVYI